MKLTAAANYKKNKPALNTTLSLVSEECLAVTRTFAGEKDHTFFTLLKRQENLYSVQVKLIFYSPLFPVILGLFYLVSFCLKKNL
jgi:hypothetical protein